MASVHDGHRKVRAIKEKFRYFAVLRGMLTLENILPMKSRANAMLHIGP